MQNKKLTDRLTEWEGGPFPLVTNTKSRLEMNLEPNQFLHFEGSTEKLNSNTGSRPISTPLYARRPTSSNSNSYDRMILDQHR